MQKGWLSTYSPLLQKNFQILNAPSVKGILSHSFLKTVRRTSNTTLVVPITPFDNTATSTSSSSSSSSSSTTSNNSSPTSPLILTSPTKHLKFKWYLRFHGKTSVGKTALCNSLCRTLKYFSHQMPITTTLNHETNSLSTATILSSSSSSSSAIISSQLLSESHGLNICTTLMPIKLSSEREVYWVCIHMEEAGARIQEVHPYLKYTPNHHHHPSTPSTPSTPQSRADKGSLGVVMPGGGGASSPSSSTSPLTASNKGASGGGLLAALSLTSAYPSPLDTNIQELLQFSPPHLQPDLISSSSAEEAAAAIATGTQSDEHKSKLTDDEEDFAHVVVFSISDRDSLRQASHIIQNLKSSEPLKKVIAVGTKLDEMMSYQVTSQDIEQFVQQHQVVVCLVNNMAPLSNEQSSYLLVEELFDLFYPHA